MKQSNVMTNPSTDLTTSIELLSDKELDSRIVEGVREKKRRDIELVVLLLEKKKRLPHGAFGPFLESIGIPSRTAQRWMEETRPKPAPPKVPETQMRHVAYMAETRQPEPSKYQPTAAQFNAEVMKIKKEKESLFENQARFILNRIKDSLKDDAPGKGLPDLVKINLTDLSPSDLDLVYEIIDACSELATRAAEWHKTLKDRFNVR